jgi:aspartokinase-like uncharacterized kinase
MKGANAPAPVVVKVGGSLLDLADLPARLQRLIAELLPSPVAIVAGGGAAADVVRAWDERFELDASTSHWLAIQAADLNARLLARLIRGCCVAKSWEAVAQAWREQKTAILMLAPLLRRAEDAGESTPPHSWDVTTDSIAAWSARRLGARLLLAKSLNAPTGVASAAAAGMVDRWFDRASAGVAIDWVNLREEVWRIGDSSAPRWAPALETQQPPNVDPI